MNDFESFRYQQTLRKLALNVRSIRVGRRLNQTDLAYKAGLTRSQVTRIESGKGEVSFETIFKVAQACGVSVANLWDDDFEFKIRKRVQTRHESKTIHEFAVTSFVPIETYRIEENKREYFRFDKNSGEIYVLKGRITIWGTAIESADEGESLSIAGSGEISILGSGGAAEILVIKR